MAKKYGYDLLGLIVIVLLMILLAEGRMNPVLGEKTAVIPIYNSGTGKVENVEKVIKTEEEWRKLLTPVQYKITREKGTERAFSGKYHDYKEKGIYQCIACGTDLYSSETKYDSKSGWPSFTAPISEHNVWTKPDNKFFMNRTELLCRLCDAHLGHVFGDGPPPTHQRHCINSASLKFVKKE